MGPEWVECEAWVDGVIVSYFLWYALVVKDVAEFEITEFLLFVIAMLTSMVMLVFMALTLGIGFCVDLHVDDCQGDFDDNGGV